MPSARSYQAAQREVTRDFKARSSAHWSMLGTPVLISLRSRSGKLKESLAEARKLRSQSRLSNRRLPTTLPPISLAFETPSCVATSSGSEVLTR